MVFTEKRLVRLVTVFVQFTLLNFLFSQTSAAMFRPSNIEIIPNDVVIDSNSTTNFVCVNHLPKGLPLQASLSKPIPSDQLKLSTIFSNATTIHIQLKSNNYVGIFNLLCYEKNQQTYGIYADVTVNAAPGVLQLIERCRVYGRQYIKCIIRASTIATAIQNGYQPRFKLTETNHGSDQSAYIPGGVFLKNESTNELLVFQWKPTVEGEFPNGVRMELQQLLHNFEPSKYNFDMTPIFIIKPKFLLTVLSPSQIQINLTSIFPPAYCEKSYLASTISTLNRTWTIIEPKKNSILIDNLLTNSVYNVCIKCRQVLSDPDGLEECQEIKTWSRFTLLMLILISSVVIVIFVIFLVSVICWKKYRKTKLAYQSGKSILLSNQRSSTRNIYELSVANSLRTDTSVQSDDAASLLMQADQLSITDNENGYLPMIASPDHCDRAIFAEILGKPEECST